MFKNLKRLALSLIGLALPLTTFAHEQWFVSPFLQDPEKPLLFREWSVVNAAMLVAAVIGVVVALVLHRLLSKNSRVKAVKKWLDDYSPWASIVLRGSMGVLLLVGSGAGFLFAPDLMVQPTLAGAWLLALEFFTGLALVLGIYPRLASLVGLGLYLAVLVIFPVQPVASYLAFAGVFVYLIMKGDPTLPVAKKWAFHSWGQKLVAPLSPYATSLLRILTGLCFALAGFLYKILTPWYSLEILKTHPLNFMPSLGFANFGDEMFVLAAGLVELTLGILLMLGVLPRLISLVVFGLFLSTLAIFGPTELIGHLPLFAILFVIIVAGPGKKWTVMEN